MAGFLRRWWSGTRGDGGVAEAPTPTARRSESNVTPAQIEERAYHLWRAAGCPGGRDMHFWLRAEAELKRESAV